MLSDHNGIKLEINNRKTLGKKSQNTWALNNILLKNAWLKESISRDVNKHFELNENENTTYQNLWDALKAVLWGNILEFNVYIRRMYIYTNNIYVCVCVCVCVYEALRSIVPVFTLGNYKKKSTFKPKQAEERNNKIRAEINKIENRKLVEKISKTKRHFLEKINEID